MDLEQEVLELRKRVEVLEQRLNAQSIQLTQSVQPVRQTASSNKLFNAQHVSATGVSAVKPVQHHVYDKPAPSKKSDLETFVGKKVTVILASVLIFVGLIAFASVLLPYLSQTIKFVLMCAVSFGLTGFGYFLTKHRTGTLSLSVLACGLGSIYITLFTGDMYFKIISPVLLYILLAVWLMAIYYCSRYKSLLFNIIGQSGIIISLFLCLTDAFVRNNDSFVFFAIIYVVVAEIAYSVLFGTQSYILNTMCMLTSVMILSFPVVHHIERMKDIVIPRVESFIITDMFAKYGGQAVCFVILCIALCFVLVRSVLLLKSEKIDDFKFGLTGVVSFAVSIISLAEFEWSIHISIVMIIYCCIMFGLVEILMYDKDRHVLVHVLSGMSIGLVLILYHTLFDTIWVSSLVIVAGIMLYMHYSETTLSKVVVYIELGLATLLNIFYVSNNDVHFLVPESRIPDGIYYIQAPPTRPYLSLPAVEFYLSCVILCVIGYKLLQKHFDDTKTFTRIFAYLFAICNIYWLFIGMNVYYSWKYEQPFSEHFDDIVDCLNVVVSCVVQFMFWKAALFDKKKDLFKQGSFVTYFVVNALMCLAAVITLYSVDEYLPAYVLVCSCLVLLSTMNVSTLLSKSNPALSVYSGMKITVLILIVFHVVKFKPVISIMMFVWAIACIVLGMKNKQKGLRIYALVLAIISTVKLVMIDLTYNNTLSRAFSLIVCGCLCFGISIIYHRLEKSSDNAASENQ